MTDGPSTEEKTTKTKIPGIGPCDARKLERQKITSAEELWKWVGADPETKVKELADIAGIRPAKLHSIVGRILWERVERDASEIESLAKEVNAEMAVPVNYLVRDITAPGAKSFLRRQGLNALLIIIGLLCIVFALRNWSVFPKPPAFMALYDVVVATRDLDTGWLLESEDLSTVKLPLGGSYFQSPDMLRGLVLTRNVSRGEVIRHEDVSRLQAMAAVDLVGGTTIARDAISLTWTVYEPHAAVALTQVVGYKVLDDIPSGEVITPSLLDTPECRAQVVVVAPLGLPAMHVIGPSDVAVQSVPIETGAFTETSSILNHFLLEAVPYGATLRTDQISTAPITSTSASKWLVTLSLERNTTNAELLPTENTQVPPSAVGTPAVSKHVLIFSPRLNSNGVSAGSSPLVLQDPDVVAVEQHADTVSITVSLNATDLERVLPRLSTSDVVLLSHEP